MSKKYFIAIGLSILFLATVPGYAQNLKLPYKDVGACPFECCTYRDWFAGKPISVFKTMNSGSPVAFKTQKRREGQRLDRSRHYISCRKDESVEKSDV